MAPSFFDKYFITSDNFHNCYIQETQELEEVGKTAVPAVESV